MELHDRHSPAVIGAVFGAASGLMFFLAIAALELVALLPSQYAWLGQAPFGWLANSAIAFSLVFYGIIGVVTGAIIGSLVFLILSLWGRLVAVRWGWAAVAAAGFFVLAMLAGRALNTWVFPPKVEFSFYIWNGFFAAACFLYALLIGFFIRRTMNLIGPKPQPKIKRMLCGTGGVVLILGAYLSISVLLVGWKTSIKTDAYPAGVAKPPNVLRVVVETTRADHVSCYGYERNTTPALERWMAEQGALFENAIVQASFSGPSKASIATGCYPHTHGVRDHPQLLSYEHTTLAEYLKERGYATGSIGKGCLEDPKYGYHQGYDLYNSLSSSYEMGNFWPFVTAFTLRLNRWAPWYEDPDEKAVILDADRAAQIAHEWMLDKVNEGRPFFMGLELYEPHFTYIPPAPFDTVFCRTDRGKDLVREIQSGEKGRYFYDYESLGYDQELLNQIVALYDGEIAFVDYAMGRLFEAMSSAGYLDSTIVVLTADHGENFGEHDVYFCHSFLYEPAIRVPLLIRYPKEIPAGTRVSAPVTNADITPTVLDLVGVEREGLELDGQSLLQVIRTGESKPYVFSESRFYHPSYARYKYYRITVPGLEGKWRAVRNGDLKLIRIPTPSGPVWEMYDLKSDPMETSNLSGNHPMEEELREVLEAWIALGENIGQPAAVKDKEMLDRLRSLGYID
jgi:arylsulfatase A-like enzyme